MNVQIMTKERMALEEGGVAEGLIRVFMAVARTSHGIKRRHFDFAQEIAATHKVLGKIRPVQIQENPQGTGGDSSGR